MRHGVARGLKISRRHDAQGILFDLDNTLAHRDLGIASYARRFARDFGGRLSEVDADAIAALILR